MLLKVLQGLNVEVLNSFNPESRDTESLIKNKLKTIVSFKRI